MEQRDQIPTSSSSYVDNTHNAEFDEERRSNHLWYKTRFHVSKHYFGAIIGRHGSVKSNIEKETATFIKIPPRGQESGNIRILGSTQKDLIAATNMVKEIVVSSRLRRKSTHFISIPMNNPEIVKKFDEFKAAVLSECAESSGLDEVLFKNPTKLHITVGVMCLLDDEEISYASNLLTYAKHKVILPLLQAHLPLKIRLKGLSYWSPKKNDDPNKMNVLYGTVQEEGDAQGLIQQLADRLVDYFNEEGYMNRERDHVRLHVTLMNAKFLKKADSDNDRDSGLIKQSGKLTFDGSEVLNKFSDYEFGVMELKDIHLSKRFSAGPDGFYESAMVVSIVN